MKQKKRAKKEKSIWKSVKDKSFAESFRAIDAKFLLVMILDALFVMMAYLSLVVWNDLISTKAEALQIFDIVSKQSSGAALSALESASLNSFIFYAVLLTLFVVAFISFFWTLARNMSWNIILKKPLFEDNALKSLAFGFTWFVMWAVLYVVLIYIGTVFRINKDLFAVIFIIITLKLIYFNMVSDIVYSRNKKASIGKLMKMTFIEGYNRIGRLMMPFFSVAIFFLIFLFVIFKLPHDNLFFDMVISFAALIAFTTWVRYYFWHAFNYA